MSFQIQINAKEREFLFKSESKGRLTNEMKEAIESEVYRLLENGIYWGVRELERACNERGYSYPRTTLTYHISIFIEDCIRRRDYKKAKEIVNNFRDFGYNESWLRKL